MKPRAYQEKAMAEARAKFAAGARAVCVVSPTGSGKTFCGSMMAAAHLERRSENRVVWLAHRTEILDQAAETLHAFGLEVGLRGANRSARVQVESVQTILARGTAPEGTLLVPDESHHFADSNRCGTIAQLYPRILGLTATPERGDRQPLKPPFDAIVVAAQISELTRDGYLVPLRIKCPEKKLGPKKIAQKPVDAYLQYARGLRAICFAPNLTAAAQYRDDFVALGVRAAVVDGKMAKDPRAEVLAAHKAGAVDVLINVGVLTEGYDDRMVACVIVGRGCGSQGLWLQMTGRGLRTCPVCDRPCEHKPFCLLLDLRGMTHELGRPDQDRVFSLEGEAIHVDRTRALGERLCRSCKAPLGDLTVCPECGIVTAIVPQATGAKLVDEETIRKEVREELGTSRMAISLAGMMRKAGTAQITPAIAAKFRGIFRHHPRESVVREAVEYNRKLGVRVAWEEEDRSRDA